MNDSYREVKNVGFGSRFKSSLSAVLWGLLLIALGVFGTFLNERSVDVSKIAQDAQLIDAGGSSEVSDGTFVAVSGSVETDDELSDEYVNAGSAFVLDRDVSVFAWIEDSRTTSDRHVGGSETRTTDYSYRKDWTDTVVSTNNFKVPEGHENPTSFLRDSSMKAGSGHVGAYSFNPRLLSFATPSGFDLQKNMVINPDHSIVRSKEESSLFVSARGDSTFEDPKVGDVLISYSVIPNVFVGTVFGQVSAHSLVPYRNSAGNAVFHAYPGNKDAAVMLMHKEFSSTQWILRFVMLVLFVFGFFSLSRPLHIITDILPILGSGTRFVSGIASVVIGVFSWIVVTLVAFLTHSLLSLIITVVVLMGLVWVRKRMKN